jgi:hypothetical protein
MPAWLYQCGGVHGQPGRPTGTLCIISRIIHMRPCTEEPPNAYGYDGAGTAMATAYAVKKLEMARTFDAPFKSSTYFCNLWWGGKCQQFLPRHQYCSPRHQHGYQCLIPLCRPSCIESHDIPLCTANQSQTKICATWRKWSTWHWPAARWAIREHHAVLAAG